VAMKNPRYEDWDAYRAYRARNEIKVHFLDNYFGPEKFEPAKPGDAGIDLYAAETVTLRAGEYLAVKTGVAVAIPAGYEGQVRPRSGLAKNFGVTVLNTPGTIDEGYRGEISVILYNANAPLGEMDYAQVNAWLGSMTPGSNMIPTYSMILDAMAQQATKNARYINAGERIAQLVITPYARPEVVFVDSLEALGTTDRGDGGFGSTGF